MSQPLRRALGQALSVALLASVVASALALVVVPKAAGAVPLTVLTGSMSGTYEPGSVVVVRPVVVEALDIGDVITFQERSGDPTLVTHRIVSIAFAGDGTRRFVTQGDANGAPDPAPVTAAQVRGEVWYSVPLAGHVATALDAAHREVVLRGVAALLLVYGGYMLAAGLWGRRGDHRRGQAEAATP